VNLLYRFSEFRKARPLPYARRQFIFRHWHFLEDVVEQFPEDAGRNLTCRFVNRHDAPDVEALFFVARQDFNFGLDHDAITRRAIEFYFSEESNPRIGHQALRIALAVEPACLQRTGRSVAESCFEETRSASAETGQLGASDMRDHSCLFARS
jgi:hypothetical protein